MWHVEQWGTGYLYTHIGPFRVWVAHTSPHADSTCVGRVGINGGKSIRVTPGAYQSEAEAKYATLIGFRNMLEKTLKEVNEMLEGKNDE